MTTKRTPHEQEKIASGWASSGLTQATYAAKHGVTERSLRTWLRKFSSRPPTDQLVLEIIDRAIKDLTAVRGALLLDLQLEVLTKLVTAAEPEVPVGRTTLSMAGNQLREEVSVEPAGPNTAVVPPVIAIENAGGSAAESPSQSKLATGTSARKNQASARIGRYLNLGGPNSGLLF